MHVYSFVRSSSAAGEDHAVAASVRVIPVIPMLLWQQARARETQKKEGDIVYISKNIPISNSFLQINDSSNTGFPLILYFFCFIFFFIIF